jgi:hypothetical protein
MGVGEEKGAAEGETGSEVREGVRCGRGEWRVSNRTGPMVEFQWADPTV